MMRKGNGAIGRTTLRNSLSLTDALMHPGPGEQ
jgi:calcium-dependent protein kinase